MNDRGLDPRDIAESGLGYTNLLFIASRDPHAYTELLCSLHPVGSPDECAERLLASARRTGIEHVIMMVEGAGNREHTLANITRLGAEVLPRLRSADLSSPAVPGSG